MWGIAVLILAREIPELTRGGHMCSHLVRFVYASVCVVLNVFLQLSILWFVYFFIVGNSIWIIQGQYAQFHREIFDRNGTFNKDAWIHWQGPRDEICDAVINK